MYGEKQEETEELKLDLQDIKNMYKAQVINIYMTIVNDDTWLGMSENVNITFKRAN